MFEIKKGEPITSEVPTRHFQRDLEYESDQVHLWLLSHKESTAGFLVYFIVDNRIVVHIRPPHVDLGPEVRNLDSTEKIGDEAIFIVHKFRKMGGMKKLVSELLVDASHSDTREIHMIDISQDWLIGKLSELLKSSDYNQIYIIQPQENEGGKSLVAIRNSKLKTDLGVPK